MDSDSAKPEITKGQPTCMSESITASHCLRPPTLYRDSLAMDQRAVTDMNRS